MPNNKGPLIFLGAAAALLGGVFLWKRSANAEEGIQLTEGYNDLVKYGGPTTDTEDAIASIINYVVSVWVYRDDEWLTWSPELPDWIITLHFINHNERVYIEVSQDCYWSW